MFGPLVVARDAKIQGETASKGAPAAFAPQRASGDPPAAFQHSIPHLAEAAISNSYMAGWDYLSAIWDTGKAHTAPQAGTGLRHAGQGQ